MKKRICLSMIVRNEIKIIQRCLESAKDHITSFVIHDTGSSDFTREKIVKLLEGIPGQIINKPWKDFSANRNMALEDASSYPNTDWILFLDADEILQFANDKITLSDLIEDDFDGFSIKSQTNDSNNIYLKTKLIKNNGKFEYQGVTHEALVNKKPVVMKTLDKVQIIELNDSSRRTSGLKFLDDLSLLEMDFKKNPTSRNCFYLARTYFDLGFMNPAELYFKKRIEMGGWEEEVYISLHQLATIKKNQNPNQSIVNLLDVFLAAYNFRPSRSEAIADICSCLEKEKNWHLLYYISRGQWNLSTDTLLVDKSAHWRIAESHAIASFYIGRYEESKILLEKIIETEDLNDLEIDRLKNNLKLAKANVKPQTPNN